MDKAAWARLPHDALVVHKGSMIESVDAGIRIEKKIEVEGCGEDKRQR